MAREIQAAQIETQLRADMKIENAQRDRQTLAAIDHVGEVGIARIVIGFGIAEIAITAGNNAGQCARDDAGRRIPHVARKGVGGHRGQFVEMREIGSGFEFGPIERRQRQRQSCKVEFVVGHRARPLQLAFHAAHRSVHAPIMTRDGPGMQVRAGPRPQRLPTST